MTCHIQANPNAEGGDDKARPTVVSAPLATALGKRMRGQRRLSQEERDDRDEDAFKAIVMGAVVIVLGGYFIIKCFLYYLV